MRFARILGGLLLASAAAGCSNVPTPDYIQDKPDESAPPFTVGDLVGHIQCELKNSLDPALIKDGYVAAITLTLKVEDNGEVSPSLSFINPLTVTGDKTAMVTYGVSGNFNVDRQRTFTTTYTVDLASLENGGSGVKPSSPSDCENHGIFSLSGNLGIHGIVAGGLATESYKGANAPPTSSGGDTGKTSSEPAVDVSVVFDNAKPPSTPPNINVTYPQTATPQTPAQQATVGASAPVAAPPELGAEDISSAQQAATSALQTMTATSTSGEKAPSPPTFGSTVVFTITANGNAGPTWSFTHFKGPAGGSGLVSAGHIDTDTLVIAFSPSDTSGDQQDTNDINTALSNLKKDLVNRELARKARDKLSQQYKGIETMRVTKSTPAVQSKAVSSYKKYDSDYNSWQGRAQKDESTYQAAMARHSARTVQAKADAAASAQNFTTNMILQNLVGSLPVQ